MTDETAMREALAEARKTRRSAFFSSTTLPQTPFPPSDFPVPRLDDVPVGAICLHRDQIISRAHNERQRLGDPTAHAEILAIRAAARALGTTHLEGVTLYVTLEPCAMCAGAIWLSRIERVVFGAWDERAGACGSVFDVARDGRLNHRPQLRGGVLEGECAELLREFFQSRRGR